MDVDYGAEPIVGYRIFGFDTRKSLLTSFTRIGQFGVWMPGEIQHSKCIHAPNHGHGPPHFNCTCGIWAVKSRRLINNAYPTLAHSNLTQHERQAGKPVEPTLVAQLQQIVYGTPPVVQLTGVRGTGQTFQFRTGQGTASSPFTFSFEPVKYRAPLILAARVHLWGVVHEHEFGYRAEFAKIIPETIRWWPRRGAWFKPKLLKYIIDKYTIGEWLASDDDSGSTLRDN